MQRLQPVSVNTAKLAACAGKTSYESWSEAHRRTKHIFWHRNKGQSIYRCKFCAKWHMGTVERKKH